MTYVLTWQHYAPQPGFSYGPPELMVYPSGSAGGASLAVVTVCGRAGFVSVAGPMPTALSLAVSLYRRANAEGRNLRRLIASLMP